MSEPSPGPSFLDELKRRKVVRVAVVYFAVAFAVLQMVDLVAEPLGLPAWTMTLFIVLAAAGLPVALVLGWAFDLTPGGVRRTAEASAPDVSGPAGAVEPYAAVSGSDRGGSPPRPASEPGPAGHAWFSPTSLAAVSLFALVGVGGWWLGRSTAGTTDAEGSASIAVLPFDDLSENAANRPFTDGLHDDLLTQLSKIRALRVTSRTSVLEYRDTEKPIRTIAEELGVAAVLEGGVQRSGDRIRINVQLIDGATDEHVWAETYDRDLTVADIFDIQSQIAAAITDALRAELTLEERREIAEEPTDDLEAYTDYLAGRDAGHWFNGDSAALLFERAAARDPDFHEAWASASRAWAWQSRILIEDAGSADRRNEYAAAAERALARARSLAPSSRDTRLAEGYYQYYIEWDLPRAARTFEQLLRRYPNDATIHNSTGLVYRRLGRWDEMIERFREATRLDPRDSDYAWDLSQSLFYMRRYEEAERVVRLARAQDPDYYRLSEQLAEILSARGARVDDVEPLLQFVDDPVGAISARLQVGGPGLGDFYRRVLSAPSPGWVSASERHPRLAILAQAAGESAAAAAYADSTLADLALLDGAGVSERDPIAERRGPMHAFAMRGVAHAILGQRDLAVEELRRSRALWRPGEDHSDEVDGARERAYGWAILGMADEFFAELEPYARRPADLHARDLIDNPILSRFSADPRSAEMVRAMQSAP